MKKHNYTPFLLAVTVIILLSVVYMLNRVDIYEIDRGHYTERITSRLGSVRVDVEKGIITIDGIVTATFTTEEVCKNGKVINN